MYVCLSFFFFFFKQKTAYEMLRSLVGSEMCIRDRYQRRVREQYSVVMCDTPVAPATGRRQIRIGVLAMQGAFEEHVVICQSLGAFACQVKKPDQLEDLDALILPGGESTTMAKVAERWCMVGPLQEWVRAGKPIWGTCAGLILLSQGTVSKDEYVDIASPAATSVKADGLVGGLDVMTHRNFFGSQVRSFEHKVSGPPGRGEQFNGLFIRAPAVVETSENVTVLARIEPEVLTQMGLREANMGVAVAVQQENVLGTSFHPELVAHDPRWHLHFLDMVCRYLDFGSPYILVE
eukprot:TRINITY_DN37731_c0_g1_i1.p1 TRINITY_DN37731_c0_g1~~TRINITY_DN37731_c0_g1_i1.p1  ORF type:complete len:292 (-),score=80.25 TRINITY_DN37731_c0_g1_i1:279-1154(-)